MASTSIIEKQCKGCENSKPLADFYNHPTNKDRKRSWCKPCSIQRYRKVNLARRKVHYQQNRTLYLDKAVRQRYGIPLEDYLALKNAQNSTCYICGSREKPSNLVLDHNHQTGQLRKFLCRPCNLTVSVVEDVSRLEATIKYLEELN